MATAEDKFYQAHWALGGKGQEGGWEALLSECDMCRFSWQMPAAFNWTHSNAKISQDHCSLQGVQNPVFAAFVLMSNENSFLPQLGHRACVSSLGHFGSCHGSRRHFW